MDYKIIFMKPTAHFLGVNLAKASEEFAEEVRQQIALGWEPQGGVVLAGSPMQPSFFQAMIKRR